MNIPTDVSAFTNDAGYLVSEDLNDIDAESVSCNEFTVDGVGIVCTTTETRPTEVNVVKLQEENENIKQALGGIGEAANTLATELADPAMTLEDLKTKLGNFLLSFQDLYTRYGSSQS